MQENTQKITKEFCCNRSLIFFPETKEEAAYIQEKLFAMGYAWESGRKTASFIDGCLQHGVILKNEIIYHGPDSNMSRYFVCKSSQLPGGQKFMPPVEQESLREEFNELSKLVREMSKKVDEMYGEVMPKSLDKAPALSSKKTRTPGR